MKKRLTTVIAPLLATGLLLSLSGCGKPVSGDPAATPSSGTAETSTDAPSPTDAEKPTVSPLPTTTNAPGTTAAPSPESVGLAALQKAAGCWNSGDEKQFVYVSNGEDGWRFAEGVWYSDFGITGELTAPVRGDPAGVLTVRLFSQGYEDEFSGMSLPPIDGDVQLDLSGAANGALRVNISGEWNTYYYAGETMDDARPPMESMRQFPAPPENWRPEGEPGNARLSDGEAARLLEKLQGNWHIQNSRYFLVIRQEEDGSYSLGFAFFEGEVDEYGYLQAPFRGSTSEMVGVKWYYDGYTSADGYVMPSIDEEVYFDLSRLSENWIGWCRNGEWEKCCYAGADMDEVTDYWYSHYTG